MAIKGTALWSGSWISPVHEHLERSLHVQRRPTIASVPILRVARETEQTPKESVAPCPQELTGENSPLYTNQPAKTKTDRVLVEYFFASTPLPEERSKPRRKAGSCLPGAFLRGYGAPDALRFVIDWPAILGVPAIAARARPHCSYLGSGDLISNVMSEMGRKGGKAAKGKGVKARMAGLIPQERKELARKAAQARWAKGKKNRKSS